ncbi:hypothetical protein J1N35_012166 [Gossypium stocksii]|uniref:Uncharacterized protein n=1 Tax=Gossypium stocksii TaxID=47602 RepID=A0A9D3W4T8_9ROSI|nr:hypothetical protein J1N35_012166 [Gossypium stocksii]
MRTNKHWPTFHVQNINIRNNRYEFLPTLEAIITPELTCDLKYTSQFRVHGKPYLLAEEVKDRQPHTRRPRRAPRHLRSGAAVKTSPSSTRMQELTLMAAPAPVSMTRLILIMTMPTMTYRLFVFGALTVSSIIMPSMYGIQYSYTPTPMVWQTSPESLFYQGGHYSQPPIPRTKETR